MSKIVKVEQVGEKSIDSKLLYPTEKERSYDNEDWRWTYIDYRMKEDLRENL